MSFAPSDPRCPRCQSPLASSAVTCSTCGLTLSGPGSYAAFSQPPTLYAPQGTLANAPIIVSPPPSAEYASLYPGSQAPGSYPPAGAPYGPPLAPRKSRRGLWITLAIIVVVLLAGGSGLAYYFLNQASLTEATQAACDDVRNGNWSDFYSILTPDLQRQFGPEDQWVAAEQQHSSSHDGVVNCTITSLNQNGSTATGTALVTYGDGTQETYDFTDVLENGVWKISRDVLVE